jgi:uncharacterized membrane protein
MSAALQALTLLMVPGLVLLAARRSTWVAWAGPVVLCYAAGIILGNLPGLVLQARVSLSVSEVAVPLALPLLLFATDLPRWLRLAPSTLLSFGLGCVASVASALLMGRAFSGHLEEWWQIAGMLAGVYTGGTVNMNAIGLALRVREETFVLLNAADIAVCAVYLVFLLTAAQRVALLFLPPFPQPTRWEESKLPESGSWRTQVRGMGLGLLLAAAMAGVSAGGVYAVTGALEAPAVLLLLTTLALGASFVPAVRHLPGSAALGDYVLLVFCVSMGSLADLRQISSSSLLIFVFCGCVVVLAVVLHFALAALFRIDAHTVLITSTATIFGPPIIPAVARALGNRELLVSGVTSGLVGYAVGTWLGLATAWLLKP